jgi:hypothetical protein
MAFKKYGYYLKGNKIAVIEQSDATSSGNLAVAHCSGVASAGDYTTKDTCEAAGGQWIPSSSGSLSSYSEYASPTESVTEGLEIQYAYSPRYRIPGGATVNVNKFYIQGWYSTYDTSDGRSYLTLVRSTENAVVNWTNAPEAVGADDFIYIGGSSRWNGLHQIKDRGTTGALVLKTVVNDKVESPYFLTTNINFYTDNTIGDGGSATSIFLAEHFVAGDYVWINGCTNAKNNGVFSVSSVTQSATAAASRLTLGTRYSVVDPSDSDSYATGIDSEYSADAALASDTDDTSVTVLKLNKDFFYIIDNVDVLNDESFELDINRYQSNAVVYYLKAKLAEDAGDMEMREFFMREFKRQLEKGVSALKRGPYMVQGFKEMR